MWHILHLFSGDLVGDDWQTFVQLHRVSIDDLTVELKCYLNGQLPLLVSERSYLANKGRVIHRICLSPSRRPRQLEGVVVLAPSLNTR